MPHLSLTVLGDSGTQYDEWTRLLGATIAEVRPVFVHALDEARALGPSKITADRMVHNNPPGLEAFSRQLYTVLLRHTSGEFNKIVAASEHLPLNGLDAWRALHYRKLPKCRALAYNIKHNLIRAEPSKNMLELRNALLRMRDGFKRYDEASEVPMDESSKCDSILAVLPSTMLEKIQLDSDVNTANFDQVEKWVETR